MKERKRERERKRDWKMCDFYVKFVIECKCWYRGPFK